MIENWFIDVLNDENFFYAVCNKCIFKVKLVIIHILTIITYDIYSYDTMLFLTYVYQQPHSILIQTNMTLSDKQYFYGAG